MQIDLKKDLVCSSKFLATRSSMCMIEIFYVYSCYMYIHVHVVDRLKPLSTIELTLIKKHETTKPGKGSYIVVFTNALVLEAIYL